MKKLTEKQRIILDKVLKNSVFDGWTERTLILSAKKASIDKAELYKLFPMGIDSVAELFCEQNLHNLDSHKKNISSEKGLSNKIAKTIILHLSENNQHKESIKKLIYYYTLPQNYFRGIVNLYKFIDKIWVISGDRSFDFSYYTKRAILANIYLLTILYWIEDTSHDIRNTENFLLRRIKEISFIPNIKSKIRNILKNPLIHVHN